MQTGSTDQLIGQTVGHYQVESLLGHGRLSAVYLAQHPQQEQPVALTTFLLPERFSPEARTRFLQRFMREATALTVLSHRNLLPIHEYGEQFGYPYLITPYMTNGSLADVLKQQGRCDPAYALAILEQVATGLEYAHRKGVFHGTLKPSNILLNSNSSLLVAGLALVHMLQIRGIELSDQPYTHLLSIADTFLYASTYIAPEIVQGQPIDARSDIYALGIILFELLSGRPPFTGASPLDTAIQHTQQPLPSLRQVSPDVPIAMELVVNHALARDPSQRFQRVGELVEAFAQVCRGMGSRPPRHDSDGNFLLKEKTANERVHNVPEEDVSIGNWQLKPPIVTGKTSAISTSAENKAQTPSSKPVATTTDSWQIVPPIVTARLSAVKPAALQSSGTKPLAQQQNDADIQPVSAIQPPVQPVSAIQAVQPALMAHSMLSEPELKDTDAMSTPAWWVQAAVHTSPSSSSQSEEPLRLSGPEQLHIEQSKPSPTPISAKRPRLHGKRPRQADRRRVVALLATGVVVAVGALLAATTNLGHMMNPLRTHQNAGNAPTTGNQIANGRKTQHSGTMEHTGTVIGATNLDPNSSMTFRNPEDGKPGLLIHLPNGQFVAYDRACTHEGVMVNYDSATHTLVCPAHGAIFDPTNNANVLQGPATRPLANVTIHVNSDGTITTVS